MRGENHKALFRSCLSAMALAMALLGLSGWLQAQSSLGSLTGTVFDPTGAVVPDAAVRVTNVATNSTLVTKTTGNGIYTAPSLLPGEYTVTVEKQGFKPAVVTFVAVFAARQATANVTLEVGTTTATVTVVDKAAMISPASAENTTTVENSLFQALPFYEVDVMFALEAVAGFSSGVGTSVGGETPGAYTGYILPAADIQAGGGRMGTHAILVDGSDNTLPAFAREGMVFSAGDVQEISLVEGGIPAQYGRTGGAIVNIATKGGGNRFHGELQWRHTDPSTQAYALNSPIPPLYHANMFGIYAGGPVYLPKVYNGKDKTWFFVDIEPYRESNLTAGQTRIYTPDELAGNLYNAYNLINTSILATSGPVAALAAPRVGAIYYQFPTNSAGFPIGSRYASASQYVQIPNDNLSTQLANNKLAQYILSKCPTPQNPGPFISFFRPDGLWANNGYNAWSNRGVRDVNNRYGLRIDHNFGTADHLFARWSSEPMTGQREAFFANDLPFTAIPWDYVTGRSASLNEVHTFGSQMVNEFRMVFVHLNFLRGPNQVQLSQNWGPTLGVLSAINGKGFPNFTWNDNYLGVGYGGGFQDIDQSLGWGDDLTWTRGRHIIRFGTDIRRFQENYYNQAGLFGGTYSFTPATTNAGGPAAYGSGVGLAGFILGELNSYSNSPLPVPEYYRWHYYAGYAQDDIKVRKNLTLQAGMRWEFETPRMEKYNHQGTFLPNLTGTINGTAVQGAYCFSGACGMGNTLWPANYRGFEPRLGLAYSPRHNWTWRLSYDMMRAPLTGEYGYGNFPEFNIAGSPVGGQFGGTSSSAWVNLVTNPPLPPTGGAGFLHGGPYYTMYPGDPVTIPMVPQTNAVPYVQTWEVDTQYQLTRGDMLEVAYVGNHGAHLTGLNNAAAVNVPNLATAMAKGLANTNWTTLAPNPLGITTAAGAVISESPFQALNPYQGFFNDSIYQAFNRDYDSSYNALYLTWTHRTTHGLWVQTSFTWDKLIDDSPEVNGANSLEGNGAFWNGGDLQNPYNLHGERSESVNDQPWHLAMQYNYQLPVGQGKAFAVHNWVLNDIIGNWVWAGSFIWRGGIPMAIAAGSNGYFYSVSPSNTSYGSYLPAGYALRPNLVPGVPLFTSNWRQDPINKPYLNYAAFAMPGSITAPAFGDLPRTICCSPSMWQTDMALQKRIPLGKSEQRYVSLEADAINVFNHPWFYFNPNAGHFGFSGFNFASLTTSAAPFTYQGGFGFLAAGSSGRQVQLGLRLVW